MLTGTELWEARLWDSNQLVAAAETMRTRVETLPLTALGISGKKCQAVHSSEHPKPEAVPCP